MKKARELILQNRRVTADKIAKQLNIRIGFAYSVVHNNLQFHKMCARWVPRELTDERKCMHLDICFHHLAHYHKGDNLLQWIVTGDETWVHHYQPETKWKSMQWKRLTSPVAKKFKTKPSAGKLMSTIFWNSQGPILEDYLEHGTTVTSATYCDMLRRGLKSAICSKRRGRPTEGFQLLHDNACPHTVAHTSETLRKLKWGVMQHPAHSPHLAPSDFHHFGPHKVAL
jgi:hypothetical protein